ncbi:hypothetical protein RSAG8_09739, partial [Rhizoctonia solani AG-8 WAC10335]
MSQELMLRAQQMQWMRDNSRSKPAYEGELLELESALGMLSTKRRWRILGNFTAYRNDARVPMVELLVNQDLTGVTFVGVVSTLLGQSGLFSQCLWYSSKKYDWFWAKIDNVESIECRADERFRGGVPCIWLTTPVAEYAVVAPHPEYYDQFVDVFKGFQVTPVDMWPTNGFRPDWWPAQSSGAWPYQQVTVEKSRVVSDEEELRQLAALLSAQEISARQSWRRFGPDGDQRYPGQPRHNLCQLLEWELAFDGGLKVSHARLDQGSGKALIEEGSSAVPDKGKKRAWVPQNRRQKRAKLSKDSNTVTHGGIGDSGR